MNRIGVKVDRCCEHPDSAHDDQGCLFIGCRCRGYGVAPSVPIAISEAAALLQVGRRLLIEFAAFGEFAIRLYRDPCGRPYFEAEDVVRLSRRLDLLKGSDTVAGGFRFPVRGRPGGGSPKALP